MGLSIGGVIGVLPALVVFIHPLLADMVVMELIAQSIMLLLLIGIARGIVLEILGFTMGGMLPGECHQHAST
jgi:hypothetical protein